VASTTHLPDQDFALVKALTQIERRDRRRFSDYLSPAIAQLA
jgi:hypothetical protein